MFYETKHSSRDFFKSLGLNFNPFKALIVPRPIGWISTIDENGVANLAPYSFFNAVSSDPPMLYFSSGGEHEQDGGEKDSLRNIRQNGQFVFNLVSSELTKALNDSASPAPRAIDEFEMTGLTKSPSRLVRPPRVAQSPVQLECTLHQFIDLPPSPSGKSNIMVIGHVVGVHIDENLIVDGRVDILKAQPTARLGYLDYCNVTQSFALTRPNWPLEEKPKKS